MAKANKIVEGVPRVTGVTLVLTPLEAEVLRALLACIGGDPSRTLRGVTDDISNALVAAGVNYNNDSFKAARRPHQDEIYFAKSEYIPVGISPK